MMGRSHALSGAVVFVAAAPLLDRLTDIGPLELLAGAVVTAGASMLPDLDHPSSTIARTFGWPTQLLAAWVAHWSGGHRRGTHSLLFALLAGLFAGALTLLGPAGQVAAVTLPLGLGVRALGWTRGGAVNNVVTFAGCALLAVSAAAAVNLAWLPAAWALGCLVHIGGDCCTHGGCPLLWPSRRMYRLPLTMTTGGLLETRAVGPLLIGSMVGMVLLGWLPAPG